MQYSVAEAKSKLTELLREFERGEQVVITRHGKPVAQLSPPPPDSSTQVRLGRMKDA
jgi:prevent-host-death family protein